MGCYSPLIRCRTIMGENNELHILFYAVQVYYQHTSYHIYCITRIMKYSMYSCNLCSTMLLLLTIDHLPIPTSFNVHHLPNFIQSNLNLRLLSLLQYPTPLFLCNIQIPPSTFSHHLISTYVWYTKLS